MAALRLNVPINISRGGRPAAACEITPEGVMAAATPAVGQPPVYAAEPIPADSLRPSLLESNVANHAAVSSAIRSAMNQVQPRVKSLTVVVPDSAVRVFLLDFDTLSSRQDEALPVLRFRLRKSVPFDVEHAGISYQILSEGSSRLETQWKVLAAIIPGPILDEYEAVVRMAGFEPGALMPASLAALAAIDSQEAVLVANLSAQALSTSIVSGNDILLYRTVELPMEPLAVQAEVQRAIAVAAAFFEDRLQVKPRTLLYSGLMLAKDFAEMLDDPELTVTDVVSRPSTGVASALRNQSVAGVTGVLMGTN
jgi:type IV pilus assembly protein PilM